MFSIGCEERGVIAVNRGLRLPKLGARRYHLGSVMQTCTAMRSIERAIRSSIRAGDELATPTDSKPFWVGAISSSGVVLELGERHTKTLFTWQCLEGAVEFLQRNGRVRINGSGKSQSIVAGTLDGYLKQHVNRLTAGWVAALLEKAGIVEIDRARPGHVRAVVAIPLSGSGPVRC